jgi:hypothetical protein
MPAIQGVSINDGTITIHRSSGDIVMTSVDYDPKPQDTVESLSERATAWLQQWFEHRWRLDDPSWEPTEYSRIHQDPPVLNSRERIEKITGKDWYIVTEMYVAVRFLNLTPPFTFENVKIMCSNKPITGEWWL